MKRHPFRFFLYLALLLLAACSKNDNPGSPVDQPSDDLITNQVTYWPAPSLNKPGYLQTVIDPVFKTKIIRIAGNPGDAIQNVPGSVWAQQQLRHNYSKIQPWNADQTMLYLNRHSPNLWLD